MTTHTSWSYEVHQLSEGYSAIVYNEHGDALADHLAEANARLIAAAPDLLAVLREAMDAGCFDTSDGDEQMIDIQNAVRAAIAKAEGGNNV